MAQCPVCNNVLNDDFGLVDCSRCGANLFIEFDGRVLGRDERASEAPPLDLVAPADGVEQSDESPLPEDGPPALDEPLFAEIALPSTGDDRTLVTESDQNTVPLTPAPPMELPEDQVMSPGLADLSSYANSSVSSGRDGTYHYDLHISGIDSSDVRNSVKEVLADALFLWDVEPLIRSISNGELKLAQVTAIKAALIVQRMSELPVKIKWVQFVLAIGLIIGLPGFAQDAGEEAAATTRTGDSKESILYSKKESRMNTLRSRIQEANQSFAKVVELKSKTTDAAKRQALAEQLAAIAKERNEWVREYTELRQELMYRYPNRGQDIDKRFVPRKERTPAELENSEEIDELLTSIKKRVDSKYAPLMPKEEAAAQAVISPSKGTASPKKKLQLVK